MAPINLADFEALAREQLSPEVWDYIAGGAEDETTIAANRAAFGRWSLRPRVLVDVAKRELAMTVLGERVTLPVLLGPVTPLRLVHPEAELAAARAAAAAGTILVGGSESHHAIGEIAAVSGATCWFQLYPLRDRAATERLVQSAEAAGCRALVLTVNAAYEARRERGVRRPFAIPPEVACGNFAGIGEPGQIVPIDLRVQPLTWADLDWLRSVSAMPLVLKGIVTAEAAALAVEHGVEAIVVSNHGGRQLDGAVATLDALPGVVAAVRGRCEVLLDGGVRRGTDVVKALVLGARAVLIGRPYVWGLVVAGQAGVRSVLEMLRAELDNALAQLGRPDVAALDWSVLRGPAGYGGEIDPPAADR